MENPYNLSITKIDKSKRKELVIYFRKNWKDLNWWNPNTKKWEKWEKNWEAEDQPSLKDLLRFIDTLDCEFILNEKYPVILTANHFHNSHLYKIAKDLESMGVSIKIEKEIEE